MSKKWPNQNFRFCYLQLVWNIDTVSSTTKQVLFTNLFHYVFQMDVVAIFKLVYCIIFFFIFSCNIIVRPKFGKPSLMTMTWHLTFSLLYFYRCLTKKVGDSEFDQLDIEIKVFTKFR